MRYLRAVLKRRSLRHDFPVQECMYHPLSWRHTNRLTSLRRCRRYLKGHPDRSRHFLPPHHLRSLLQGLFANEYHCSSFLIIPCNIRHTSDNKFTLLVSLEAARYPKFVAITNWVSSSVADPSAIRRKCTKSFVVPLLLPSAIFEAMNVAALCICDASPYTS